jgi:UDP-GlcNAc:undecaprenyl-phosphate/decaprenyl-phosphate GlcNAc-1-phosphate transferase
MPIDLLAAIVGFTLASALLPLLIRWALQQSLLDFPDDIRRRHTTPTPRIGGVAVFVATALTATILLSWEQSTTGTSMTALWPGLLAGAAIVFITGLLDDIRGVVPAVKLIAHTTAAGVVIAYGFQVDAVTLSAGGAHYALGWAGIPLTVLWIVGVTNAFNLIDGVDGLAATFGVIGLIAVVIAESLIQPANSVVVTAAALGAMLAFMRYNRPPAKIFLGDSGSTTLGFLLSIQIVVSTTGASHETYALVPLFALAYPLTDTTVAIARRWLRGHPFSRADGRHIHHQLLGLGLSQRRTVDFLALVFSTVAITGVSIAFASPRFMLAVVIAASIVVFVSLVYAVRWLGYHEFSEFAASVISVLLNARSHVRHKIHASDLAARLQGAKSLDELKALLGEGAEELGFLEVSLETYPPQYVGPSHRRIGPRTERPLRVDCPITWDVPGGQGQPGEATLRFWCDRPGPYTHLGAERLATRLAPAVQHWFQVNHSLVATSERRPHMSSERRTLAPTAANEH